MRPGTKALLGFGLALALLAAVLRLLDPGPVRDLRLAGFDYLQRLYPRAAADLQVRVVDIDEASLAAFGQWPWPRDRLADLTDRLGQAGAAVVVFDILFAEPDRLSPHLLAEALDLPPGAAAQFNTDRAFAEAASRVATVFATAQLVEASSARPKPRAGLVEIGEDPMGGLPAAAGFTPLVPELDQVAAGLGAISISSDRRGGPVRRLPLAWSGPDGAMPALPLEAVRLAFGETTLTLWGAGDLARSLEGVGLGDLFVPTSASGSLWLYYRPDDPTLYLSAANILSGPADTWADKVDGHIVLVGTSAAGLFDLRSTALGEVVPGVAIHAQAIEQILSGSFLTRSDTTAGLEVLATLAGIALIALAVAFLGPVPAIVVGLLSTVGLLGGMGAAFTRHGQLFDGVYPSLAAAAAFLALAAYRLIVVDAERRAIRRSFSHYVAPDVLGEIERQGHRLQLGGETRDVTVLFSDMRDFTGLSEDLGAEGTVALLNGVFDVLGAEIVAERGTIDKFMGDAVMAFWNAPVAVENHPERAVAAALAMRRALAVFNQGRATPVRIVAGIATGPAAVGNIGSKKRFNYSVIGDTVNLASRIEAACRQVGADILISEPLARAVPDFALLDAGLLRLRGVRAPVQAFAVVGDSALARTSAFLALQNAHAALIEALRHGAPGLRAVDEVAHQADALLPGLGAFFKALPDRRADYLAEETTPPRGP
ncbi:MAG: adenylate/guanylate cyclase domain-containing protein [Pseudomonadota bacterium]